MFRHVLRRTHLASTTRLRLTQHRCASSNSNSPTGSRANKWLIYFITATRELRQRLPGLILLGLIAHISLTYVWQFGPCSGVSMLPTINSAGDWTLTSRWYRRGRGIKVGDLVSYAHPIDPEARAIKRVIGLEGDFVLRDTPGVGKGVMIQVPKGHCWVAGDNLKHSRDSRMFGPLPLALIKGKVIRRWTPWHWPEKVENGLQPASLEHDVD